MINNLRVAVVLPAYHAAKALPRTYAEKISLDQVGDLTLADDASRDDTVKVARALGLFVLQHDLTFWLAP